jgi:hypothetical protein
VALVARRAAEIVALVARDFLSVTSTSAPIHERRRRIPMKISSRRAGLPLALTVRMLEGFGIDCY